MDVIVDPSERVWLLEINPRWTASMELAEIIGGFRWASAWSDMPNAFEAPKECLLRSEFVIGKGICYAPIDLEVSTRVSNKLFEHKWARTPYNTRDTQPRFGFADIPFAGESIACGHPITTCLAIGNSHSDLVQRLKEAEAFLLGLIGTEKGLP